MNDFYMISTSADGGILGLEGPFQDEESAKEYALYMFRSHMEDFDIGFDELEDPPADASYGLMDHGREGAWEIYCDIGTWAVEQASKPQEL